MATTKKLLTCKRALQADPQFAPAYAGVAASLLTLGDLDQAEALAIEAIKINALAPGINEILGIIFLNRRNTLQAVQSFKNELAINPQSHFSLLNLGLLLLQQGEAEAAIEPLQKAAAVNPSEQCSLLLAQAYQSIGNLEEAIREYKKINLSKTQDKLIPFNLGLCLLSTGSNIDAIAAFKLAIQMDESFLPAWGNIGTALINEGRHHEALPATRKVLELAPNNPTALMNLGSIYKDLGNLDQALASTLKSLDLKPDNPDALMNLGGIYQDLGKLDQALASILKSLELKPDNPDALMNLGSIYKDLGNFAQASVCTLKSLELNPHNPTAHMNMGFIYKECGNLNQAIVSTLKSVDFKPDNPDAHMNLGIIYETLNQLDSALESYTKSANLIAQHNKASSLTSMISMSAILLQMNRIDDAKKSLSDALAITLNKEITLKWGSTKNNKSDIAYLSYLIKLMPEIPYFKTELKPQILHLGESHCLAFANQTIEFKGETCSIKPSLVKGAKAFHLSEESRANQQKIGFEKRLQQNLDVYKQIFLSFGEIDCREDEGILLYCKKSGKSIQDIAKATAAKYFKWTVLSLKQYKDKLVYFGIPAPFKIHASCVETSEIDHQRLIIITIFNTTLAGLCYESGAMFANVYELTAGKDGYNNNEWMIDTRHLKPKALKELVKAIQC